MPMVNSTRHKTDRICPQSPSSAAKSLKYSFTKLRKGRSNVEKEKGKRKRGTTEEREGLTQCPWSPSLRPVCGNGGSWYIES